MDDYAPYEYKNAVDNIDTMDRHLKKHGNAERGTSSNQFQVIQVRCTWGSSATWLDAGREERGRKMHGGISKCVGGQRRVVGRWGSRHIAPE